MNCVGTRLWLIVAALILVACGAVSESPDLAVSDLGKVNDLGAAPVDDAPALDPGQELPLDLGTPEDPGTPPPQQDPPELWFGMGANIHSSDAFEQAKETVDRAVAAGYTGVVFSPFKENQMVLGEYDGWQAPLDRYQQIVDYIIASPLDMMRGQIGSTGYGEGILRADPNMAEGLPIRGAEYRVSNDGTHLEKIDSFAVQNPEFNGTFETFKGDNENLLTGWQWNDAPGEHSFQDTSTVHSGAKSLRIEASGSSTSVLGQFEVTPFRQYHVRIWLKTQGVDVGATRFYLDIRNSEVEDHPRWLDYPDKADFTIESDQDWAAYDLSFNSLEAGKIRFAFGVLGTSNGNSGKIWFDDLTITEAGLINLVRREGAPVTMRKADETLLTEGVDYVPISDPLLGVAVGYPGRYDRWHEPPVVEVIPGGQLVPGDVVTLDHFAVQLIYSQTVTPTICNDLVFNELTRRYHYLMAYSPSVRHFRFSTDENRQMNWGTDCDALGLTPGELLAQDTKRYIDFLRKEVEDPRMYVYNDMFDPHHNAKEHYYFVNGELTGAWEGLDEEIIILNWKRSPESYQFFADRGMKQVIVGATTDPAQLFKNTEGIEGIIGAKFENYNCGECTIENFAEAFYTRFEEPQR